MLKKLFEKEQTSSEKGDICLWAKSMVLKKMLLFFFFFNVKKFSSLNFE